MKKNKYSLSLSLKFLTRVVLLTIMGTSFLCFSVKGDPVEPQRVSLNLKDVSLSVLFQEMKKQTSYKFFYNDVQVKDVGNITVVANNETVESVLERVFQGKEYTYRISGEQIIVTGNTVIDALYMVVEKIKNDGILSCELEKVLKASGYDISRLSDGRKLVLITGHRRENFGDGFISMCKAIKSLSEKYPEVDFVYPMHLNPNVRKPIHEVFGESQRANLFFIEPLEYLSFVYLMEKSAIVLTDSGGIQEEAPGLGKPVLVMRDTTERPEALEAGTVKLVGTDYDKIVNEVSGLLDSQEYYEKMSKAINPYGDGKACSRIVKALY